LNIAAVHKKIINLVLQAINVCERRALKRLDHFIKADMMIDPTEPKKASTGLIIMVILGGLLLCCVVSTLIFLMIKR